MKPNLTDVAWQNGSYGSGLGQGIQVAVRTRAIAVRDSKNPDRPAFVFRPDAWTGFARGVIDAQFRA